MVRHEADRPIRRKEKQAPTERHESDNFQSALHDHLILRFAPHFRQTFSSGGFPPTNMSGAGIQIPCRYTRHLWAHGFFDHSAFSQRP
jgi:hypothetical protein